MIDSRPLWPPVPPSGRNRRRPSGKREIVEHDQHFGRLDLVKLCDRQDRVAAAVHVARRLDRKHIADFAQ